MTNKYDKILGEYREKDSGSGGGAFIDLTDVPSNYIGSSLKVVRVNVGATGLEFATISAVGDMTKAVYDPANIGEQLVGLTTAQTLTNKTLTSPKINENVALTATATELNILDGATLDVTELNYVDGVTSSIQTQFSGKASTALSNLASVAINTTLVSDTDNTDSLGTAAISWSDLFLGSGAVITWSTAPSTSDITLTHSSNDLTLAGGSLTVSNQITATDYLLSSGGTAADPSIRTTGDPELGIYFTGTTLVGFAQGGSTMGSFNNSGFLIGGAGARVTKFETDGTLAGNSDTLVPTQKAVKTYADTKANSAGALTQFVGNGNWKVFYSDGSGDVTELALGADGTFLKSNGAALAPSFATPAGSGDVSKVGTPVDNQVGVWTGDGTLEGDVDLTFDTSTNTLATGIVTVADEAYDAGGWDSDLSVPTKNAVRDKIESMGGGVTESFVIAMATAL